LATVLVYNPVEGGRIEGFRNDSKDFLNKRHPWWILRNPSITRNYSPALFAL